MMDSQASLSIHKVMWQRPKNLSQRQAWTVTYGQIIFTLTPFFCLDVDVSAAVAAHPASF